MNLKETLEAMADFWKYELEETAPGFFRLDMTIDYQDGTSRNQYVFVRTEFTGQDDERIYITSRCGLYDKEVDLYGILREASDCFYSTVTIFQEEVKKGKIRENVVVQAAPSTKHTSLVLLSSIIYEVARKADTIEQEYFGGDNH